MIREENGEATVHQADLTDESACQEMARRCAGIYGRIDILDNNVGIASTPGNIVQITKEEWDHIFAVNLKTMIYCSKAAIPIMIKQGGGSIINIASYAGIRHTPMIVYATSKAAMIHLAKLMAVDHGPDNIRVNCIAPGYIDTPMAAKLLSPEIRRLRAEITPLGRMGTAWDVAWAAVYLASDEADFVSGVVIPVDGGRICKGQYAYLGHTS
jgi:NAD(P)-dependent dehydrogenase (short-subunit alcohol dehydrogenase family)